MLKRSLLPLTLLALVVGCSSNLQTRQYQVMVVNDSSKPVTVWLTKNGEMYEEKWKSPEDFAVESPKAKDPVTGVVVPAHEKRGTDIIPGRFRPETDAILRVYQGQLTFNEILAAGKNSSARKDVVLKPGRNDITITDTGIDQQNSPLAK